APFLAALSALWCWIGGWIARHEWLAERVGRPGASTEPSATAFAVRHAKSLLLVCPLALLICLIMLLPVLLAGSGNAWLGAGGALVVAMFLPLLLLAGVCLLVFVLGAAAWPLMPVALAVEQSDCFDALSRAYSYLFQRPLLFLSLNAMAGVLAAFPLAVLLLVF